MDSTQRDRVRLAVRTLRKRLGLTQEQLGRELLVHRNSIYRYEAGSIAPSPQVLLLLVELAGEHEERSAFAVALVGLSPLSTTTTTSIHPRDRECNV
jgi:transcriptional regulator with XRE-family HTH domain